ncbi:MAG TPA: S-layer homology domain-containing protein, partial [Clostridiaceae bacterium]|nr:S-layer homology domain-containing protein [Clostridiaceae bacterium]
ANYAWAKKEIEVMASKGIINGTSATTFNPSADITRADFIVLLARALGLDAEIDDNFSDVNPDAYYAKQVGIARKLGIAKGSGNNEFRPNDKIERQEMMTLIDRALKVAGKGLAAGIDADLEGFADKDMIASYATDSVAALVKSGIIKGDGTNINPLGNTTRAEAAVVIYRIYNMLY